MITALVLLPLVLAAVLIAPTWMFAVFMGCVVLLGAWEWSRLIELQQTSSRWSFLALIAASLGLVYSEEPGIVLPVLLGAGVAWWLYALTRLAAYGAGRGGQAPLRGAAGMISGWLVLVPAWGAMVWMHTLFAGPWFILLMLVIIWAADSGAYFAGRAFGRRKLAPAISPGKTWEGAMGGLLVAVVCALLVLALPQVPPIQFGGFILLVVTTTVFSIAGDLYESMIKRRRGVKDSGSLLPGHGGVLDRIDSLTAAAPIFAAGLYLL
nr:phosphatidate cytidylyltransferase [Natronocella acetinitrilica]